MNRAKKDSFVIMLFLVLLSYLTYKYVRVELPYYLSDYNGHTYVYYPLFSKTHLWEGWKAAPYFMWHGVTFFLNKILLIPLENSAAYSACFFAAFSYLVFYWILQKVCIKRELTENSTLKLGLISFLLCVAQPITLSFADTFAYSMNPLYSPTQMCVRPFALLCFCLVYDIWGAQKDSSYHGTFFAVENGLKKYYVSFAILLFLSTLAKPTFAEMFIPAAAFSMLFEWISRIRRKNGTAKPYFRHCLFTLYCSIPALLYILLQFTGYFLLDGSYMSEGSFILTRFLEVWKLYSENVALSLLLSLTFPLFLFFLNPMHFFKNDAGRLALACCLVSFLEAAFFGESGIKFSNCNFFWPMMSAMLLLFTVCTVRLLVLEHTQAEKRFQRVLLSASWLLFGLHGLSGILFILTNPR